jgi:hypothetical protein
MKLKAVAEQDVIAQMGTLLLWAKNPPEKDHATDAGNKLLTDHPAGLLGALLMDGMRDLNVRLSPRPDSAPLQKLVKEFPPLWLNILDQPQSFYVLRAELVDENGRPRVLFPYGEPMIARVAIKNISKFDITIGPDGVIKNDLWFDANLRGLVQQVVAGAAYERLGQKLVLKPADVVYQTLRLDQGQLSNLITGNPQPTLTFYGQVRTNPRGDGFGPCGQSVAFASITERAGFNTNDPQQLKILVNLVANGNPAEKMRSLELLGSLLEGFKAQFQQNPGPQLQTMITGLSEQLNRSASDEKAEGVRTWARFLAAVHNGDKRQAVMQKLLDGKDAKDADAKDKPTDRLLGMMIANILPADQKQALVTIQIEQHKDPITQLYGSAMLELIKLFPDQPATTQQTATPVTPGADPNQPAPAKPANPLDAIPFK